MSFETDKQTLDDLNLLGKYKNNSVYSLRLLPIYAC